MRMITDHIVNPINDKLAIAVLDPPGAGGASHKYYVSGYDLTTNPAHAEGEGYADQHGVAIIFQNGGINERGVNGLTQEVLLAIVIDRLQSFQEGPFPHSYNEHALAHAREALDWLQKRTRERMARGVEGKTVA